MPFASVVTLAEAPAPPVPPVNRTVWVVPVFEVALTAPAVNPPIAETLSVEAPEAVELAMPELFGAYVPPDAVHVGAVVYEPPELTVAPVTFAARKTSIEVTL